MKVRLGRNGILLGAVGVCAVGLTLFLAASLVTEQQREEALRSFEAPESVARHAEMARAYRAGEPVVRGSGGERLAALPVPERLATVFAAYERLFLELEQAGAWAIFKSLPRRGSRYFLTDEQLAELEAFVAENPEVLALIREAAEWGGPVAPVDLSQGFRVDTSHAMLVLRCSKLLAIECLLRARQGDPAAAAQSILAGMKLAGSLAGEPHYWPYETALGIHQLMGETFREAFPDGRVPPEEAHALLNALEGAYYREACLAALAGWTTTELSMMSDFRNLDTESLLAKYFPDEGDMPLFERLGFELFHSAPVMPLVSINETALVRLSQEVAELAQLPYYEAQPQLDALWRSVEDFPLTQMYAAKTAPVLAQIVRSQAPHEARVDLMRLGIALELYRAEHEVYPLTLDAVAAYLGGQLPVDPFTGTGFRYEANPASFVLYSLGPNLIDDAGRPWRYLEGTEGDIVWTGGLGQR